MDQKHDPADRYVNPMKVRTHTVDPVVGKLGEAGHHETKMEWVFGKIGASVVYRPWTYIICSLVVSLGFAAGFFIPGLLVSENRPEKQWVPTGAAALEQKVYVDETWPSTQRFNFFIAKCRGESCNILEPKYAQRLRDINDKIMNVVIDGQKLRASDEYSSRGKPLYTEQQWHDWGYNASFQFRQNFSNGVKVTETKCFEFGPFCGKRTMLEIYREDDVIIDNLTMPQVKQAVNFWEGQENFCPISIARLDSPCVDTSIYKSNADPLDCQKYTTLSQRKNCRMSAEAYCNATCPTVCVQRGGPDCIPSVAPGTTCGDSGCLSLVSFNQLENDNAQDSDNTTGSAPESAFAFEPFKVSTVLSSGKDGPKKDASGKIVSAKATFGFYALADQKNMLGDSEEDPIALEWEKKVLCILGRKHDAREYEEDECPEDDLLEFFPNFQRSLTDEFGSAIRGDVAKLGSSYVAILFFMFIMLSRRDTVHSMMGMGVVTILIVGLSYLGCMGAGAYLGLSNNQLNNNIPFLLLGLGVDDAFVLAAEFLKAADEDREKKRTIEDYVIDTAKHGGISILITSATDALAFLVGAYTVLPALSWFCTFAGIGVIFCFVLQVTLFLPALLINARRAEQNRLDCLCCIKAKENHPIWEEKGCCFCCKCKSGMLRKFLKTMGEFITKGIGRILTLAFFLALFIVGLVGAFYIYKDFKLEWFFPDDSYVNQFFNYNNEYFASGKPVTVYVRDIDYFKQQETMEALHDYLNTTKYTDPDEDIEDWHHEFLEAARVTTSDMYDDLDEETHKWFKDKDKYYEALHNWYADGGGVRYRTRLKWSDPDCEDDSVVTRATPNSEAVLMWDTDKCNFKDGLSASRVSATLRLEYTDKGQDRYDTMSAMRLQINKVFEDSGTKSKAFPYSFEFLYWEEVGIIDAELGRNLAVCGVVVIIMVSMMIPHPRIAAFVALSILLSVADLVGFMYWWGVTISGVSTIYVLISVVSGCHCYLPSQHHVPLCCAGHHACALLLFS